MEGLRTPEQVAELLGIRARTVHELVRRGKLQCYQVTPKERRFSDEQVRDYLEQHRTAISPPRVDKPGAIRVPFTPKIQERGDRQAGGSIRAQDLKKEMRSWR